MTPRSGVPLRTLTVGEIIFREEISVRGGDVLLATFPWC
jgi:hypothetical protein